MGTNERWHKETVFHDGDAFFDAFCAAIAQAKKTIDLETYIFDKDSLSKRIVKCLCKAADRGVKVRLLLDGFGSSSWSSSDLKKFLGEKIEYRFFHPLPWQRSDFEIWNYLAFQKIVMGFWKLNRRNHRKTLLIDKTTALLGSMNISERHLKDKLGADAWRDTSALVEGPQVLDLHKAFDNAWEHFKTYPYRWKKFGGKKRFRKLPSSELIRLNVTRTLRRASYMHLIRRILQAKKRVWITNPYFIPDFSLILALRAAAKADVDVKVLLSKKSDVLGIKWAIRSFYLHLLSGGVRIYEYFPSVLHAKVLLIDGWASVGSSNLNHRSLHYDLESDVILEEPSSVHSIEKQFAADLKNSEEIKLKAWKNRSWIQIPQEKFALLFKRWL